MPPLLLLLLLPVLLLLLLLLPVLLLVLLLVMVYLRLPLIRLALLRLVSGIVYDTLSVPLHLVQQGEMALGTAHPGEGAILHDRLYLRLVQLHETISVE